jgi:3-hydroxymyristoyl/3-hydroxydecanoyl-(acyl carrier protein) dehydratase
MPLRATLLRGDASEAVFSISLTADLQAFQGHFPGDPLLPGVVQVDWACRLGQEAFGPLGRFTGLDQIKFLEPIRPSDDLELALTRVPGKLRFQYLGSRVKMSSGTILFATAP